MSEKIAITAHENEPQVVTVETKRKFGGNAIGASDVFQIPVMPAEGQHGELVLNAVATGEEVFRGDQVEAEDYESAA